MTIAAAPAHQVGAVRLAPSLTRLALVALVLAAATLGPRAPRRDVVAGLGATAGRAAFSIVGWEAAALTGALGMRVSGRPSGQPSDEADQVALVRAHFANTAEIRRLRERRDALFRRPAAERADLPDVERQIAERQARFDDGKAVVEEIVGRQVDATLRDLGLRGDLLTRALGDGWPLPFLRVDPPVFFRLERLPLNLLVAPRDRIAIVGSVLVSPDLDTDQIEQLEGRVDALGVSSLVSGIGGFGSYPSMVPDTESLPRSLDAIAHEWAHHHLTFRPLGRTFFSSYEMRTINETVADLVGDEVGRLTYERYYRAGQPTPPVAPPARPTGGAPRADFGAEMRRIRAEVERLLAAGDVAGAEAYMAGQRIELGRLGWQVRRLNTAYLSFFGAYGGGGNRFEAPLRALRASSGSLAAFLARVERFTSPADALRGGEHDR
jgi:hypothetical protein